MADYYTGSFTLKMGNFKIGDLRFPITVVEVDVGADLIGGDKLMPDFTQQIGAALYGAVSIVRISGLTTRITDTFGNTYPFQDQQYTVLADDTVHTFGYQRSISTPRTTWAPFFRLNGTVINGCYYTAGVQADLSIGVVTLLRDARTGNYIAAGPVSNGAYAYGYVYGGTGDPIGVVNANGAPSGFIDEFATSYRHTADGTTIVVSSSQSQRATELFSAIVDLRINIDPYIEGGTSEPGGGSGTFSHTSVPVDIPGLPTTSAADTGFITLFNPSLAQLRSLASYMWSSLFDVDGWHKLFADPMDAILGLSIVPVSVQAGPAKEVKVGNIGTGITLTTAASQYVVVDCGSLNVEEYWGAYLDYAPYTKAELYLPYCGVHPIQIDDIMGRTVAIKYHVDVLSGSCVAFVKCGNTVLYSFAGQCSSSIPINANNWTNVVNGALSIAGSIGTMVATGGLSAPISAGTAVAAGAAIAGTAMTMKPQIERSGSMGGTAGMMGIQTPYLILTRPRQALPDEQNQYTGYPSYITSTLGDLTGWTTVSDIHLEGVPCTEGEASEIINILKSGVIL